MIEKISSKSRRILPSFMHKKLSSLYKWEGMQVVLTPLKKWSLKNHYKKIEEHHRKALKSIENKENIKVAFFATFDSVWKFDSLYSLMENHPQFNPIIIVCPIVNNGKQNMLDKMEACYKMFIDKKFNVIRSYNKETNRYIDVKEEIQPDIIFYTNPYKGLIDDRYYITEFKETLTCYVPYAFMLFNEKWAFNQPVQNLSWKVFYPHEVYKSVTKRLSDYSKNVVVTGYPTYDRFYCTKDSTEELNRISEKIWKTNHKKIIWAPHHTINKAFNFSFSNFIYLNEIIFEIAEKYKDQIEIAFKPHPLLKGKLYLLENWGKEKTDAYYKKWEELPNGILADGDYVDLFKTSDAMIHDSGSFIVEYHYTLKPIMFFTNNSNYNELFIQVGKDALEAHYKGSTRSDIEEFIEKRVLENKDSMFAQREKFFKYYLVPPNEQCVSKNILNEITNSINHS